MVRLGNFVAQQDGQDGVPRILCGSVRWPRHRKDGVPRTLCG